MRSNPKAGRPLGWRKQNARVSLGNWRVKRETRDMLKMIAPTHGGIGKTIDMLVRHYLE